MGTKEYGTPYFKSKANHTFKLLLSGATVYIREKGMKRLIATISIVILTGCVGVPVKYVTGDFKIENSSDHQLVNEAANHAYYISTIYGTSDMRDEVSAIAEELKKRHPDWAWDKIMSRQVTVGMSMEEVMLSWGNPSKVNRSSYGSQWIYRRGKYQAQYLYFENGILKGFNES